MSKSEDAEGAKGRRLRTESENKSALDIYGQTIRQLGKATDKLRVTPTFYPDKENGEIAGTARPVSFILYTLELIGHLFCWTYLVMGLKMVDLSSYPMDQALIAYSAMIIFYTFLMLTIVQSICICTGYTPSIMLELLKATIGFILFLAASISSQLEGQQTFYVVDFADKVSGDTATDIHPFHPFCNYLKYKSVSSLTCSILYLLHATLLIDIELSHYYQRSSEQGFVPIEIYVLGEFIQRILEEWKWFHIFCSVDSFDV